MCAVNGKSVTCLILLVTLVVNSPASLAQGTYLQPELFVAQSFQGETPKPEVLWLTGEIKKQISQLLGNDLKLLRVRYWGRGDRTAWVLEHIGKERPITTGVVVEQGKIKRIQVLIFREKRGWEVRNEFFTRQFEQAKLTSAGQLDRHIDGISGATLSVRALKKIARLALFLHQQTPFATSQ